MVNGSGKIWLAGLRDESACIQFATSFTNGGIDGPMGIAIDSQNNVWIANFGGASVTELNSAGTPVGSSPLTAGRAFQAPSGIAINASGSIWTANAGDNSISEFVGIASPVAMPLAANVDP